MSSYRIAGPATRDLDRIWDYHHGVAGEEVANRQIVHLHERFQILAEYPYMGVARYDLAPEVRSHAIPNTRYIIFYFPKDYGVEVARVAHGSQDLHRLFE